MELQLLCNQRGHRGIVPMLPPSRNLRSDNDLIISRSTSFSRNYPTSYPPSPVAITSLPNERRCPVCFYGKRDLALGCGHQDEKFLFWYSGPEEKKLRLSKITNIIHGHNTKQLQLEKESQCLSLIYEYGKSCLELICKDELQAESWFLGLKAVISRNYYNGRVGSLKKERGIQSCINSPAAFMRRKQILGLSEKRTKSSEILQLTK